MNPKSFKFSVIVTVSTLILSILMYVESGEFERCISNCANEVGQNRSQLCYINSLDQASVMDVFKVRCGGLEDDQLEEDQLKCLCNYCKYKKDSHLDFCIEPGEDNSITHEQCEELACTGKAKCLGEQCNHDRSRWTKRTSAKMNHLRYKNKCEGTANERKRNGEFGCYEHAYLNKAYILDTCDAPFYPERKLAPDQGQCFRKFCKEVEGEFAKFCEEPGKNKSIQLVQCDELVCTGQAKYRGEFCIDGD